LKFVDLLHRHIYGYDGLPSPLDSARGLRASLRRNSLVRVIGEDNGQKVSGNLVSCYHIQLKPYLVGVCRIKDASIAELFRCERNVAVLAAPDQQHSKGCA
jgi:hypothetical protein